MDTAYFINALFADDSGFTIKTYAKGALGNNFAELALGFGLYFGEPIERNHKRS